MNLKEIRQKVVELSGRYDLIVDTTSWADNGMDYYINNGLQMLGRLCNGYSEKAKLYFPLSINEYSITFQHHCRVIFSAWINDRENRRELEKIDLNLMKTFFNTPVSSMTSGTPRYFSLAELRALETTDRDSLGVYLNKTWNEADTNYDYRGLLFASPADKDYIIEVNGLFKNALLSNDNDENYWTLEEFDLLIRAALYKLEGVSRGTENAKNWLSAIKDDVKEINFDIVEEESYGITQLEG